MHHSICCSSSGFKNSTEEEKWRRYTCQSNFSCIYSPCLSQPIRKAHLRHQICVHIVNYFSTESLVMGLFLKMIAQRWSDSCQSLPELTCVNLNVAILGKHDDSMEECMPPVRNHETISRVAALSKSFVVSSGAVTSGIAPPVLFRYTFPELSDHIQTHSLPQKTNTTDLHWINREEQTLKATHPSSLKLWKRALSAEKKKENTSMRWSRDCGPELNNRYSSVYSELSPTDLFIHVHLKPAAPTRPATREKQAI